MKPNVLISTVGTSLLTNLNRIDSANDPEPERFLAACNWSQVARWLRGRRPDELVCGAEINTVHLLSADDGPVDSSAAQHFCVSDTTDGSSVGSILCSYYQGQNRHCEVHTISGLQDADANLFRTVGLRNLVQTIGNIVRAAGGMEFTAINATGGYKAQIALASVIGQTMGVTVYYKHERFPIVIAMPPMPVCFDYELLGSESALLDELSLGGIPAAGAGILDARLEPLIDSEKIDDTNHLALSALGELYLEGWRFRHPPEKTLPPATRERKEPKFAGNHHRQRGFQEFIAKVYADTNYITGGISGDYSGQRGIRDREFSVQSGEVVAEYRDRSGFGGRFVFRTTAVNDIQRAAVVDDLNARYGRS